MTTTIADIHAMVTTALAEQGLDPRLCYVHVASTAPAGEQIVLESSSAQLIETLSGRLADAHPPVECIELPNDPGLPERLVAVSSVADVRREPGHAAELATQLIDGDAVTPLKTDGDWYLVRLDDGYIGWVRSWHMQTTSAASLRAFEETAGHRVADNVIQIQSEANDDALPLCDAVVGTPLIVTPAARRGWRRVQLSNGREGYVRSRAVEPVPSGRRVSRERVTATGMRFLGIPYLWGGNTPKGFDCSGLVQRVFKLHGIRVPRDSDLQSRFGREKTTERIDTLDTADLLFFCKNAEQINHVAIYLSNGLFLHAYGQVKVGALDPLHPLYEPKLHRDWRVTRAVLSA